MFYTESLLFPFLPHKDTTFLNHFLVVLSPKKNSPGYGKPEKQCSQWHISIPYISEIL